MELPIQPISTQIRESFSHWMAPFLSTPSTDSPSYIMNLSEVEQILHDHFVSMEPLTVTYECYDNQDQFQELTQVVYVHSTIDNQRSIQLLPLDSHAPIHISTEQILSVFATTENLWR